MIKLHKLEKPSILLEKEDEWTQKLMLYYNKEQKMPKALNSKYAHKQVKNSLIKETNHKCAYCESKITAIDYGDVEHIEPKSKVPIKTFEWTNLTLSCGICNQNKKDYYNPNYPLINPYIDNPEKEIVFLGPYISPRTQKAKLTIKLLDLNRMELFESRKNYIDKIQPMIDTFFSADDEVLKALIYKDIHSFAEKENEYSAMMKSVISAFELDNKKPKKPKKPKKLKKPIVESLELISCG